MSAPQSTPHEPERLEQIVSYLDGELTAEESARVERRLATDEAFRQELQSIDRAWSALDELPLTTVEDRFSKTTMEMVVQRARGEVDQKTRALPVQKRKRNLGNVLLAATAGLLGFLVFRISWENPNRPLLADLPVIQHVDIYAQFRDVDFLRQLNNRVPSEAWAAVSDPLAEGAQSSAFLASSETGQEWLQNITEDERLSLRAKYNRFRALPAEQQGRLRQLHEEISASEDAEQLRQTMRQYQQWLGGLPASEQYELRELTADKRVNQILRMLQQHALNKSLELTPEELQLFFQNVKSQLEREREKILEEMSRSERARFEKLSGNEQRKDLIRKLMRNSWRGGKRFSILVKELIPEEKYEAFRKLSLEEKRRRFAGWMWEAHLQERPNRPRYGRRNSGEIPEQELEQYFTEELDAASIERLLALPREKMQQQLQRRYRGGMPPGDWESLLDRDHGPPRRPGPPRPGEDRRMGRPRPHDWHGERPGPPFGRERHDREHRPPAKNV